MSEQHDYDGIRYREEKSAPLIFKILFFGLATWGLIYSGYYLFSGWSSEGEFKHKKQAKQELQAKAAPAVASHKEGKKEDYLAMGKKEFAARCAACHGADAKGGAIGPDLTRKEFKFGRNEKAVKDSISEGRPGGMPSFKNELSHEQIEGLVQYVLSLSS